MAGRFPDEWLEELRSRVDLVSIVSEHVVLKQSGRKFIGLCPFHNEKTASFHVDPELGFYHCFGCKAGGTVFQFVMSMERMEFHEAVRYLADKARMPLPAQMEDADSEQKRSVRESIHVLNLIAARFFHETLYAREGAETLAYLHGRGLDDPVIRAFGIGAAPPGWDALTQKLMQAGHSPELLVQAGLSVEKNNKLFDMFRGRAIFPIINAHGAVLGFGGRAMGDAKPKYINTADTPVFNKRLNVYAANMLRKERALSRVLLVEGYMDVVSLARHGIKGAAATLGTALTEDQAKLLKRYAPEIWIAYDGDSAGQNAALRALDIFQSLDIPASVLVFPDGKDPDDFVRVNGREAFDSLKPLSAPQFRMRRAADGLDLSTEEGRTKYAIACASILRAVTQPVELDTLLKRLTVETGFSREVLLQQIGIATPDQPAHKTAIRAQRTPRWDSLPDADHSQAEKTLLTLMVSGLVPDGIVDLDRFANGNHRQIAVWLSQGKSAAGLLESCDDEGLRNALLDVLSREIRLSGDEVMDVITECMERMQRVWVQSRINALTDGLQTATDHQKSAILQEINMLNMEKNRLRPGRKE